MKALVIIEAAGKAKALSRILSGLGVEARILPTCGHVARFPEALTPIGISFAGGWVCDPGRKFDGRFRSRLSAALDWLPADGRILLATDNDDEGHVIALDVLQLIERSDPGLSGRVFRMLPSALTPAGIAAALEAALPVSDIRGEMVMRALPGRTRAVSDRWIGAVFSDLARAPVGRVRTAVVGAFLMLERAPELLQGRPETGEVLLRCRSASGGADFVAHVSLDGTRDSGAAAALVALARRHAGSLVPGAVRARQSLSAAVAPRIGQVRPFNTGDALAHAARHYNLSAGKAMQGLQDAYLAGLISYPRTASRMLGRESAASVIRLADGCGLTGLSAEVLHAGPDDAGQASGGDGPHEALHPVPNPDPEALPRLNRIIRTSIAPGDHSGAGRERAMEIMTAIVARRAFEAARVVEMEPGDWRPGNADTVTSREAGLLSALQWSREITVPLPWSRDMRTGVRKWPLQAVVIDMMMGEGLGRPSTLAAHAETAADSGYLSVSQDPLEPPRPTPQAMAVLRRVPRALCAPAVCRLIEQSTRGTAGEPRPDDARGFDAVMRRRVGAWLRRVPDDMRALLLAALPPGSGGRARAPAGPAAVAHAPVAVMEATPGMDSTPGPFDILPPTPFPA